MNLRQKILASAALISAVGIGSCAYDNGEKKSEEVKAEYLNPKTEKFDSAENLNQNFQDLKAYNELLSEYEIALSKNDSLKKVTNSQSQKINAQREYIESLDNKLVPEEKGIESEREYISNLENRIDSLKKLTNEPKSRNTWSFIIPHSQSEIDSNFKDVGKEKYLFALDKMAERIEIKDEYIRTLEKDVERLKENSSQNQ